MNVFAIYAVNEHLADLMAEAKAERLARKPKGPGFVASLLAAARRAVTPPSVPVLDGYPYRS
jgi:hypothetical protein